MAAKPTMTKWPDAEQRQLVQMAAEREGTPLSTFIRRAAVERARDVVVRHAVAESTGANRK